MDPIAAEQAKRRTPHATIRVGDFFQWAMETKERFDSAVGNPPFIRYQRFSGQVRTAALSLCARLGAKFTALTSSWAPFLVATASLLKPGGRLAFVVPAEIGHAPYASPLLSYLTENFDRTHIVAVRSKIFRNLSADCWLLQAEGFGGKSTGFHFSILDSFEFMSSPPAHSEFISLTEWHLWNKRIRPFLVSSEVRAFYQEIALRAETVQLKEVAKVGIGYVTGANDFFHLRPSSVRLLSIPDSLVQVTVRSGKQLKEPSVTQSMVRTWLKADAPVLLLKLSKDQKIPPSVSRYLDSAAGQRARETYKCRTRDPWYVVPDVKVPDGFVPVQPERESGRSALV